MEEVLDKKVEHFDVPNSVTKIGFNAFKGCTSLKSIKINKSVKEIGGIDLSETVFDYLENKGLLAVYTSHRTQKIRP